MTNNLITLTIPNDDHVALRAFGKALEEMALAHGASPTQLQVVNEITVTGEQTEALRERLKEVLGEPEVDTTAEQFASLARMESADTEQPAKGLVQTEDGQFDLSTGAQVDSTGTPWDERIHSASKALNSDGTWRLRRKPKDMDEAEWVYFVDEVKNELMGVDAEDLKEFEESKQATIEPTREEVDELIEASNEMLATIEPPVTPPGDDFHTDADVVTEQTVVGIPPIPVPPPVVVPPVPEFDDGVPFPPSEGVSPALERLVEVTEQWTFPKLMKFLTERHGRITVEQVNQLLAVDGLAALTDLNAHPDKIGPFVARVKAHLGE